MKTGRLSTVLFFESLTTSLFILRYTSMQIPLLHQQIMLQTERLRELHRSIMLHTPPVPATEIENLLKELRSLYNTVLQLNNENAIQLLDQVQLAVNQFIPEVKNQPIATEVKSELTTQVFKQEDKKEEMTMTASVESVTSGSTRSQSLPDIHTFLRETNTFASQFEDRPTLGDKMATHDNKKRYSDNLRIPVKDIKSSIGLNEKFLFINQLFKGDSVTYNAVVDRLNTSSSIGAAMDFIQSLAESNNWETHSESAKSFIDIIERRFLS